MSRLPEDPVHRLRLGVPMRFPVPSPAPRASAVAWCSLALQAIMAAGALAALASLQHVR